MGTLKKLSTAEQIEIIFGLDGRRLTQINT